MTIRSCRRRSRDFEGLFVDDPEDFRIQPCLSPVWDTAINIIALAESGLDPMSEPLQRAANWMYGEGSAHPGGLVRRKTRIPIASGWAFEFNNVFYPDTDDTTMVLIGLRMVGSADRGDAARYQQMFQRALDWLLSFQCRDGGWAAFDRDVTKRWLEDVPFADHNAILDPTCSDLTGRTLELLGYIGFDRALPPRPARHPVSARIPRRRMAPGMGAGASITSTAPGRSCAACAPSAWT